MHSQGHNVYNNTVKDCSISGITAYGSGNENIFNNDISGSRIGILLGGGYYNVTIGENTYDLDYLPFPPTFVTYLAKAENKYSSAEAAIGTYTTLFDTVITAKDIETTSKDIAFELTLTTAAGKAIANQTVAVTINNVTYNATTDANGAAKVTTTLENGKYDVSMAYAGKDTYVKTKATSTITVADSTSSIIIDEVNGEGNIIATLKDGEGKGIANETVVYTINNVKTNVTTDENGKFEIACGNNKVSIIFEGNDKYLPSENAITLNITVPSPEPTPTPTPAPISTTIDVKDLTVLAGENGILVVTLKGNGTALVNQTISVEVDGEPLFIGPTDENGTVNVSVNFASAATKYAYVSFIDTTGNYLSSLGNAKITVNKKVTTLTAAKATLKVKKAKKITVTLKSSGKVVAGKKVTITVNKKTFTAKTNKNGKATISVKVTKKGKFTATVKFAGDATYKAVTKKVKYTVK